MKGETIWFGDSPQKQAGSLFAYFAEWLLYSGKAYAAGQLLDDIVTADYRNITWDCWFE
jgi:uncharacterized PurR-regulated membrane protein YhhQ (DUF165 family)